MADSIIPQAVRRLFTSKEAAENLRQIEAGLIIARDKLDAGLDAPHRLAHYLAQLAHESAGFRYDRELWGPTPAQERYDVRTDLGNTPERDGDGFLYRGRTAIQLTGKANVQNFMAWCADRGLNPPDFVKNPDLLNEDPWEGLVPVWYWVVGNPSGRSLNALADVNDIEQITKRVNGGLNGYSDRLAWYTRIALAMAGFSSVRDFQVEAKSWGIYDGLIDGDSGPLTRAALHRWLAGTHKVQAAPVVQTKEVVPESVESKVKRKFDVFGWLTGVLSGGGLSLAGLAGVDWRAVAAAGGVLVAMFVVALLLRHQLVAVIRDIKEAVEDA